MRTFFSNEIIIRRCPPFIRNNFPSTKKSRPIEVFFADKNCWRNTRVTKYNMIYGTKGGEKSISSSWNTRKWQGRIKCILEESTEPHWREIFVIYTRRNYWSNKVGIILRSLPRSTSPVWYEQKIPSKCASHLGDWRSREKWCRQNSLIINLLFGECGKSLSDEEVSDQYKQPARRRLD